MDKEKETELTEQEIDVESAAKESDKAAESVEKAAEAAEKTAEVPVTEKETKAETAETVVKKKKKTILFVAAGIVLVAAVIGLIVFVSVSSREKKLREHLDLGDRYFAELEYDKAIAEYKNALDIDPDCKEAFEGIVNCYLAMAAAKDDAEAILTLEKGSEELKALGAGSEYLVRITERLQFLQAKVLEEPEPDPEPTPIPEPTPTPEPEPVSLVKKVDLSAYENVGYALGGVIPVMKGGKWGAVNYDGKSIISCAYSD